MQIRAPTEFALQFTPLIPGTLLTSCVPRQPVQGYRNATAVTLNLDHDTITMMMKTYLTPAGAAGFIGEK